MDEVKVDLRIFLRGGKSLLYRQIKEEVALKFLESYKSHRTGDEILGYLCLKGKSRYGKFNVAFDTDEIAAVEVWPVRKLWYKHEAWLGPAG